MGRLCLLLLCLIGVGYSQVRITDASSLLEQARATAQQAKASYSTYNIDQPLWREVFQLGAEAQRLEPDNPDIALVLAQAYSYTKWYIRAWEQWQKYLTLGKTVDDAVAAVGEEARAQFADVGNELGFAAYEAANLTGALDYYQQVNAILPNDLNSTTWLGRIYLELGQPVQALPYWQRAQQLDSNNASIAYYLGITEEQIRVGPEASSMFQTGIQAYEAGKLEEALRAFEWAISANDTFTNAYVWAARTSLELGQSDLSMQYWQKVLELDPEDTRAAYFAEYAQTQQRWGQEATTAFYEGQTLYAQGDLAAAASRFEAAATANPQYKDAFVWAARSYQELEEFSKAIPFWERVLELDPNDSRASYFLLLTEKRISSNTPTGSAFMQGIEYYQRNDFINAEAAFKQAVAVDANFADAWVWLGRVYFTVANYAEAAKAYERASQLVPDNSDYRFFAQEARRLAGQ